MHELIQSLRIFVLSHKKRSLSIVGVILLVIVSWQLFAPKKQQAQYQTTQAEKGTLITTVAASGIISSGSTANITTSVTGVVSKVYVKSGDKVTQGQKIADIVLDQDSQQKQAAAWAAYLSAQSAVNSAQSNLYTLQSTEFIANQKFMNDAIANNKATNDPVYIEESAQWLAAEAGYKNQQTVISQAQAALTSAALSYQQLSSTITAPASGVITNLIVTPGFSLTGNSQNSSSTTTTSSSYSLGSISLQDQQVQATVNLSEVDVTKVQLGQHVTLSLNAFPDKTFTGTVSSINTSGVVSSGVTSYPVTITLDNAVSSLYPNMAVDAKIITSVKDNVLLIPTTAVQTFNGQSTVRIMKNGQIQQVSVSIRESDDTNTEITSGLSEGETVVTSSITAVTGSNQSTTSPFGSTRGFSGGFGGGFGISRGGR